MLNIDPNWKKIGISLSGGADSALLTYLVCNSIEKEAEIHIITQIRCWKTRPWAGPISLDVFNWFVKRFPHLKFIRHENFIPPELEWGSDGPTILDEYGRLKSGNQIILRAHNEYIAHREKLDAWFAGVNKNPPENIEGSLKARDNPLLPETIIHMGVSVNHPFINITKDWIIQQYFNLNLLDLLNITRSCEGDNELYPEVFQGLDYRSYIPGQKVPECGKCFWCLEKQWGVKNVKH